MALSIQEQLQSKASILTKRLYDYKYIRILGSSSTTTFILDITQDKFKNNTIVISDYKQIWCRIEFPGKETPSLPNGDNNQSSSTTLMLYEILPIEAYFLSTDTVKKGNIILYKLKLGDGTFQVIPLQLVNTINKSGLTDVLIQSWIVAPPTDWSLDNNATYLDLVEKFKDKDKW
jgi:hypothetical protein